MGRIFKQMWYYVGKRKVMDTEAAAALTTLGKTVSDPKKYLAEFNRKPRFELKVDNLFEIPLPLDNKHPEFKETPLYIYKDSNVLVQGIPQAQVLLKTLAFDKLPDSIMEMFANQKLPTDIERSMHQSVLVSHLLDAEQKKTAKIVNPLRPMRPYPRNYGITEQRKNLLLSHRLMTHCERFQGQIKAADRKIVNDAFFIVPFERNQKNVQFEITAETLMTSRKPINSFKAQSGGQGELPDIFPVAETASIPRAHFYNQQSVYPLKATNQFSHPHTVLLHYSKLDVKHLFETPVTEVQFESRAMLKGFAVAASRAQSLYGAKYDQVLEKPITVQVVQIDGKRIQFGIFQLNTLALDSSEGVKNYWFSNPSMELYNECLYRDGRPALTSYNFDVFRLMNVFYSS